VKCSPATCAVRDPQGHYKKLKAKKLKNFVGASQEYEAPKKPELALDTDKLSLMAAITKLHEYFLAN
jgi:adenylylsulfate kinase